MTLLAQDLMDLLAQDLMVGFASWQQLQPVRRAPFVLYLAPLLFPTIPSFSAGLVVWESLFCKPSFQVLAKALLVWQDLKRECWQTPGHC